MSHILWIALALTLTSGFCLNTDDDSAPNSLTAGERADGWELLFDGKTTHGWRGFKRQSFPADCWAVEDGWLRCLGKGGNDIVTDAEFEEFELCWEWKLASAGNSGVKYFLIEARDAPIGHEYQILDDDRHPDAKLANGKRITAALYDVLAPNHASVKPPGEINQSRILAKGNHVEHWLNGEKVLEYECGSKALQTAVADSKFKHVPRFGTQVKGNILLQDHGDKVWFRSLKIRDLSRK